MREEGGWVYDPEEQEQLLAEFFSALHFGAIGVTRASISGRRAGNREYPLHLLRGAAMDLDEARIGEVVRGG